MSDPSKKLMGKPVTIKPYNVAGNVRGYDPANKKWWVVICIPPATVPVSKWYSENQLEVTA